PQRYRLSDSIIVLAHEDKLIGLIVNAVRSVEKISPQQVEPIPSYGHAAREVGAAETRCLAGVAKVDADIVMLLQLDRVLQMDALDELAPDGNMPAASGVSLERGFCPDATAEERAIFQERARSLMQPIQSEEFAGQIPLAVTGLNGEYFAIDLEVVREFAPIDSVVPVPCCPEHIVGQMNLRGDIVTLMDIRSALQMPLQDAESEDSIGQVVVVEVGELRVGVLVDEVLDVLYLHPAEITPTPVAVQALSEEYLKGTAPYGAKMLSIIDLPKILDRGDWVVDEEV
ncbi:MAG: chemotaxis protein CheW, partial [Armatimonadota bacterium]|nr:chemotaxis protein CheW [Armatimonadota bacterium]